MAANELAPSPTNMFNSSIINLKKGEQIRVYKKNEKTKVKNYRPIMVLNVVNKVFEQRLNDQINLDPYLYNHVCRRRHSCIHQNIAIRLATVNKLTLVSTTFVLAMVQHRLLTVSHIPEKENIAADEESRKPRRETEWSLQPRIATKAFTEMGK